MLGTSRKNLGYILKEKSFWKFVNEKDFFVLKMYDLIITNVDLLANSSKHEVIFPEYSRNMPRMSVLKIFQGYPQNIVKLWKYFYKSKSSKNAFVDYLVKIWNWQSFLSQCFSELYWNRFTFRVMLWKGSHRPLTAGKNFKIAQHYHNHYKSFLSGI